MIAQLAKLFPHFSTTSKNYGSSFKIRSKLAEFFKHVHPDQLQQAPTKIKQQNLKSLKNFNSYIDSINQEKPIEAKLLKFYISQKMNHKSKKFFSFTIQLPEIKRQTQMNSQQAEKLMDNIVNVLNRKFQQSRNIGKSKDQKTQPIDKNTLFDTPIETENQRMTRLMENIQPFPKRQRSSDTLLAKQLKSTIDNKYREAEKDQLMFQLKKNISFADTATNKPMMWSRLTMNQSGIYSDYQKILSELIDPKLIFFAQELSDSQIKQFKKRLLPGQIQNQQHQNTKQIAQVCEGMQKHQPPICFYVTTHFSGTQIPGFFSIPFNFKPQELLVKFKLLQDTIVEQTQKYQQYYDYHLDLISRLKKKNNILIKLNQFKNNDDIWIKILMLKRLEKYQFNNLTEVVPLNSQQYLIFTQKYKLSQQITAHSYQDKIVIAINFQDQHFQQSMPQIHNKSDNA